MPLCLPSLIRWRDAAPMPPETPPQRSSATNATHLGCSPGANLNRAVEVVVHPDSTDTALAVSPANRSGRIP